MPIVILFNLSAILIAYLLSDALTLKYVLLFVAIADGLLLLWALYDGSRKKTLAETWVNPGLLVTVLLLVFCGLELAFAFTPRSHGVGFTLGARVWHKRYWHPINSNGYRDREPSQADVGKRKIVMLGDSFVAGYGLKVEKRFANRLEKLLGPENRVFVVAKNGHDTRDQLQAIQQFDEPIDWLVLSYYGNDIKAYGADAGVDLALQRYPDLSRLPRKIVEGSFLFNYLYWRKPRTDFSSYRTGLLALYQNSEVLKAHLADLGAVLDIATAAGATAAGATAAGATAAGATAAGVPCTVVIFPYLDDLIASRIYTEPVGAYAEQAGCDVVQVSELAERLSPAERVVNSNDGHASAELNELLAQELYQRFEATPM